ncbi:HD domain-containing phosphohydrolase [Dehalogenimonas etheniformans]|uniref:HD domain-containing protein n=1 Tax=Dehalogenimonas etheniformans TaxID=1536648 RepID=A0A2P5P909_9CHLR|nr:HD domain-containing phosphohydrolase [Dehalogenimonas etheniformans]PPD58765.1 HD domain-containing protein [Dehalogenimonas etheniformans]QNT76464.1 response regulator [Dehalogenimonas etheniformans]
MATAGKGEILLVVDGDDGQRKILSSMLLSEGYHCLVSSNAAQAMELVENHEVALAFLATNLCGKSGFQLLREIKAKGTDTSVIIVADAKDVDFAIQSVKSGAYDFVTRPVNPVLLGLSIRRALETRRLESLAFDNKRSLESKVAERTRDLSQNLAKIKSASIDTIMRLSRAAEFKDEDTGSHIERMSRYTAIVADRMGLPDAYVESMLYASSMHDIGKIGIPDSILLKSGKLSSEEWEVMKRHTIIGAKILDGAEAEVVRLGGIIALSHHEKWNGTGYPFGFKGEDIPLSGRIAAIADVFDSLTSKRVYRADDFTADETFRIIEQSVGVQFDPAVFTAFKAAWPDIVSEQERFRRLDSSRRETVESLPLIS